jgi:endonuclease/exonuclease/phosphatase family metal-dependent hydrolase
MNRIRIATWNIHKGIGRDGRYDLGRTMRVLEAIDADVLCLQEVDEGVPRSNRHSQAEMLSKELKFPHMALGLNVAVKGGHYGNLTLSRLPITASHNLDLTVPLKKRRSGLVTRLEGLGDRAWTIVNLHLGLLHLERRTQLRWLLEHLIPSVKPVEGVVLAGDWNDWGNRLHAPIAAPHGFHVARPVGSAGAGHRTFPSRAPMVALDKILYREPVTLRRVLRVAHERARVASDHLPLVADLILPAEAAEPAARPE